MRRALSAAGAVAVVAATMFWAAPPSKAAEVCGPAPGHTADARVILRNNTFQPATVTLSAPGMSVCWEHQDGDTPHSITSDAPPGASDHFDFPRDGQGNPTCVPGAPPADCFQQGDQPWKLQPNSPGTFPYHCKIHPNMKGVITVQGAGGSVPPARTSTTRATTGTTSRPTGTTIGTLSSTTTTAVGETTTTAAETSTTSSSSSSTTSTTIDESAVQVEDDDDDDASGVLQAVGAVLLVAVIAGLIPAWRRLT